MPLALLLLVVTTLGGALLTYLYDEDAPLGVRLSIGLVTGSIASGLIGYGLALLFGMTPLTVVLSALPLLGPLAVLRSSIVRARLRRDVRRAFRLRLRSPGHRALWVAFLLVGALLVVLFRGAMYEENGEIWTTNHYNLGDLPWHLAIIQGFAVGENFPPQHPEFAGTRLTYPFMVDFIAAQYTVCGATLTQALLLQNLTLAAALLTLLHWWAFRLTRSRFAMTAVPVMALLSGGWAWMSLLSEAWNTNIPPWQMLMHLPHDYTTGIDGIRWGNMLTTLLITQRGLMLAVPLALTVFVMLFRAQSRTPERWKRLAWAGGLTGLVPLSHGHTFLTLLIVASCLALLDLLKDRQAFREWLRDWASFFAPALVVAAPQALVLANGSGVKKELFFGWQPGWDTNAANPVQFLVFWYKNTGPLFLLLALALFWRKPNGSEPHVSDRLFRFYLPFIPCFILPNLLRFAPWIWDNIKILIYWFLGTLPLVGVALAKLWHRGGFARFTAAAFLFMSIAAGGLDVWRLASSQTKQMLFDRDGIAFATLIREKTPPRARLLHAGQHNHPALLAGRPLLSGYDGHLWSHGLDYEEQADAAKRIYAGGPEADALIARYKVRYIIVGPAERTMDGYKVNDAYLARFPEVGAVGPYSLREAVR